MQTKFKLFEAYMEIPLKYKLIIRECIDIIKPELGELGETTEMILDLIATNKTLYYKIGKKIVLDDAYFNKNFSYVLDNIKIFFDTVYKTFLNGFLAELIVENLLTTLNYIVSHPTKQQNIDGIDLITIKNGKSLRHQVKFIYEYVQDLDNLIFEIKNRYLDIKKSDIYDYIWFFVNDRKEVVLFKKSDITVKKTFDANTAVGYSIKYTKIQKYEISEDTIKHFEEEARKEQLEFNNIIDNNYDKFLILRDARKYNL